jgi:hypothetical protein
MAPAQHLAQIIDVIDKARPIVESSRRVSLTSGKLTYPSITARPTVTKQVAEKEGPGNSKMTVVLNEALADTFMGVGDLSWQTVNWSSPDALALWFDLCAEAYAAATEAAAAATLVAGATATAVPVATNDLAGWLGAITAQAGAIRKGASRARSNTIYMDVTTGYQVLGLVSASAPVFLSAGGGNVSTGAGNIAGMQFVISDALPAGTIIVGDSSRLLCAETAGAPVEMRAVEVSIGGLEVGVIGAFASEVVVAGAFGKLTAPV